MDDSFSTRFGNPPPGIVCRDRRAAYAVIHGPDGHVAVVCVNVRGHDEFWLPGGGMLDHESPEQTIVREVREELGRTAKVLRRIGESVQFFYAGDEGCWYKMVAHFFAAELQGDADEQAEYELHWVDPGVRKLDFFHECHAWAALGGHQEIP
ncbi:MAG: NUDIX domain-containing protein [Planctomycetota bacterium]